MAAESYPHSGVLPDWSDIDLSKQPLSLIKDARARCGQVANPEQHPGDWDDSRTNRDAYKGAVAKIKKMVRVQDSNGDLSWVNPDEISAGSSGNLAAAA